MSDLVNTTEIRSFLETIHAAAASACEGIAKPGMLQLFRIHPGQGDTRTFSFPIGAVDAMAAQAEADARAGFNVYIEPRTVQPGPGRGTGSATRAVFALVADDDNDTGRPWVDALEPSLVVATSPGNTHRWHFLSRAIEQEEAQAIGLGMKAAGGGDSNTGTPTHPYRIAGTPNYPGKRKRERGRTEIVPTAVLEASGAIYTADDLRTAFPAPEVLASARPAAEATGVVSKTATDLFAAPVAGLDRSKVFFSAVCAAADAGMSPGEIEDLARQYPGGCAQKYMGPRDRLGAQVDHVYKVWRANNGMTDAEVAEIMGPIVDAMIARAAQPKQASADPVDLWGKFAPPALPRGSLPPLLEEHARVQAELMGVDPGGLAAATLAVCAAAIPDNIKLQVKRHDPDWRESARIWVALIGESSTRKTPVMSTAMRPLARLDGELYRQYARALGEWQSLPKEEQKMAPRPAQTRLRIQDTTVEAAQEVLKDSPAGVLCQQDELSGWFGSMDKYNGSKGGQADRAFWLQAYNGGEYVLNRIGRGSVMIDNMSVSMLGGIQPDPIRKLAADGVDDGLLQRLFPIMMADAVQGKDVEMPNVAVRYGDLITRLHTMKPPHGTGQLGAYLPVDLQFDDGAQAVRRELERKHIDLAATECINKKLASHVGKYDGLFARLCIVWHCVENADAPALPPIVTEGTAGRVAAFLHGFLLRHAFAFYAGVMGLSDDHERITSVAGYILAHKLEVVTNRDVQRGNSTMRGLERHQIQRVFEQMEALGWLEQAPPRRAMDPPVWKVNPAVHALYAARAESERTRRLAAREAIAEMVGARG